MKESARAISSIQSAPMQAHQAIHPTQQVLKADVGMLQSDERLKQALQL